MDVTGKGKRNCLHRTKEGCNGCLAAHGRKVRFAVYGVLCLAAAAYVGYAAYYDSRSPDNVRLIVITALVIAGLIYYVISSRWGSTIYRVTMHPIVSFIRQRYRVFKWIVLVVSVVGVLVYIIVDVALKQASNLMSAVGIVVYLLLFFVFSKAPTNVQWRPIYWGMILQFIFALVILRTTWGFDAFKWLGELITNVPSPGVTDSLTGDRVEEFFLHANAGARFVFGEKYTDHVIAMQIMPLIVFFSSVISILYYLGIMQVLIKKIAWLLEAVMGITAAESLSAAASIFLGVVETPLAIRPLVPHLTASEMMCIMTTCMSTISGVVLGTYILIGIPSNHLLSASIMSAPAGLAISKLYWPETEQSKLTAADVQNMPSSGERNLIEAASNGASQSIKLVASILVTIISFFSILAFLNATLTWFGARVGLVPPDHEELTFQLICSYVLWPFAFVMGISQQDCRKVAELIGLKTFLNEFVAYSSLTVLLKNRQILNDYNGTVITRGDDLFLPALNQTLEGGVLTPRSEVISTYALCGFSNFGSIGMMISVLGSMAPEQKPLVCRVALPAMIAGNVACFITACIAGIMYTPEAATQ